MCQINILIYLQDHRDRTIWLWEQLAARYKDNTMIAGYNLLNEPCDPEHVRLPALYDCMEPVVRKIDPNHILWLDGNTFAVEWRGFEKVLPNTVYAMHDYSVSCVTLIAELDLSILTQSHSAWVFQPANHTKEQTSRRRLLKINTSAKPYSCASTKHQYASPFLSPLFSPTTLTETPPGNGEFGPVYASERVEGPNYEKINQDRYSLCSIYIALIISLTHLSLVAVYCIPESYCHHNNS